MFGNLRKQVETYYFDYREVRALNMNEYELPNPWLIRYLTSGNKKKAQEHIDEIFAERDKIAKKVILIAKSDSQVSGKSINPEFKDVFLKDFFSKVNAEGQKILTGHNEELRQSIFFGWILGKLDEKNLKKSPPQALGIHIDCMKILSEEFPEDIRWATNYCVYQTFYLTRAGLI